MAHDDFTFRGSLGEETKGYDGFIDYARSIRTSLDGYHCEILACVGEADRAFAKMSYSGRHKPREPSCAPRAGEMRAGCSCHQ